MLLTVGNLIMIYIYIYIISQSETFMYFRFITCKVNHFKCFLFLFLFRWLELTAHESQKSVSQNIRIFPKIKKKKDLLTRQVQVL